MTEVTATDPVPNLLRILNPDAPLYRIFPLWFFEEAIRLRQLVLAHPRRWEDPYEVLPSRVMMTDQRAMPWTQTPLEPFLQTAYAQCWSRTEESDTLLRAYSKVVKDPHFGRNTCPQDEGVRVRSSARKLAAAMQKWTETIPGISCYVGAVRYGPRETIHQHLATLIHQHGPDALGRGELRAELHLLKRDAFRHEAEVRLIGVDGRGVPEQDFLRIPIEPSAVFEEVTFDPRLEVFERREREAVALKLGYSGLFKEPNLYQKALLVIPFPNGWKKSEKAVTNDRVTKSTMPPPLEKGGGDTPRHCDT